MVYQIYPDERQLNKANASDAEASFFGVRIYLYLMVQFPLTFIINGTILILTLSIFRSLLHTSYGVYIYLNLFVSLEHRLTLLTSIVVTMP